MGEEHRDKIRNSNILRALIEHVEGKREMSASQVTAGLGLLRKVMPDLAAVEHSGEVNYAGMSDEDLDRRLRELIRLVPLDMSALDGAIKVPETTLN